MAKIDVHDMLCSAMLLFLVELACSHCIGRQLWSYRVVRNQRQTSVHFWWVQRCLWCWWQGVGGWRALGSAVSCHVFEADRKTCAAQTANDPWAERGGIWLKWAGRDLITYLRISVAANNQCNNRCSRELSFCPLTITTLPIYFVSKHETDNHNYEFILY